MQRCFADLAAADGPARGTRLDDALIPNITIDPAPAAKE
jgi:hypothetical protein